MKIYYVMPVRLPSEKAHTYQIMKMCEALADYKNEVVLLTAYRRNFSELRDLDPYDYYNVRKNFEIKKVYFFDLIWLNNFLPGRLHYIVLLVYSLLIGIISLLYCWIGKADVVMTRDSRIAYIMSLFFNVIYEVHTFSYNRLERYLERVAFGRCKLFIIVTKNLRDLYIAKGYDKNRMLVLADGVDIGAYDIELSKEEAKRKQGFDVKEKIVGYIGNFLTLGMEKGLIELIKSSKHINIDGYKIVIVGGPIEAIEKYKSIIKEEGLDADKFIFRDRVEHRLVPELLKAFDCCLMPFPWNEHYAYYMSPLKMFEYMASRRPIIVTDLPSVREVLDEESAVMVEVGNVYELGKAIEKVLIDEELYMKKADKAYGRVKDYTWHERVKKLMEYLGRG